MLIYNSKLPSKFVMGTDIKQTHSKLTMLFNVGNKEKNFYGFKCSNNRRVCGTGC